MTQQEIETHPFQPFLPENSRLLMLGTFPPAEKRWNMPFYYPNFQNDMWRIFGLCFFGDKDHFIHVTAKKYDQKAIERFLNEKGVALYDTATQIRRTKNTASDKDLEIVKPTDLDALLHQLPHCKAVVTAGQLATSLFASHFGIPLPKVGEYNIFTFEGREWRHYRMPSSSRAYPMRAEQKAAIYQCVFDEIEK